MFNYPTEDQAFQAGKVLLSDALSKPANPLPDAVNAAWVILGYGLSLGVPMPAASNLHEARVALSAHTLGDGTILKGILSQLLPVAIAILQKQFGI